MMMRPTEPTGRQRRWLDAIALSLGSGMGRGADENWRYGHHPSGGRAVMKTFPNAEQERQLMLAELRLERLHFQRLMYEVEFIGVAVNCRSMTVAKARLALAEIYGSETPEEGAAHD